MNPIRTGLDQVVEQGIPLLKGKKLGLLTNLTGIDSRFRSTIDIFRDSEHGELAAFFACEHGIRNEHQAGIKFEDETDAIYGLPIYSLYGKNRKPTADMLHDLDAIVIDIQDLGFRFYTYLTTLVYIIQACAACKISLIVLDRPNPLGGKHIEGGLLREGFQSMVGPWKMPAATGMTIGEFAQLVNHESDKSCELHVIPLTGWDRDMEYTATGLPWILPSPNIPTIDTVRVYCGNCVFEGTNLSEGRGTTRPFEVIGAPWLRHWEVCQTLNEMNLPGVWFHPVTFTPTFSKHSGALCNGIMTYITDKSVYRSAESGLHLLHQIAIQHENQFEWIMKSEDTLPPIDLLTGNNKVRLKLQQPGGLEEILKQWNKDSLIWEKQRAPYLLY